MRYVLLSRGFWYCKSCGSDDSTQCCAGKSAEIVVNNFEQPSAILFEWLNNNYIKTNTGKSHLSLSGNSRATATFGSSYIESEDEQVLVGITIDSNPTFENHISSICKSKVKCPFTNHTLHEYTEMKKNHEVFCNFLI